MSERPISIKAIDHINLSVPDLASAIDFYSRVFNFVVREDHRDRTELAPYVILGAEGRAYLAIYEEADAAEPEHPFVSHWGFVVGDLDPVLERLRKLGVPTQWPDQPDGVFEWAHSRSVYIRDPAGHDIELVENFGGGLH